MKLDDIDGQQDQQIRFSAQTEKFSCKNFAARFFGAEFWEKSKNGRIS